MKKFCISLMTTLAVLLGTSCSDQNLLPESFGVYLRQDGELLRLDAGDRPEMKPSGEFVLYGHGGQGGGSSDPERGVELSREIFIRMKVELYAPDPDEEPTRLVAEPSNRFEKVGGPIPLSIAPVEGKPGMFLIKPRNPIDPGFYALKVGNREFSFSFELNSEEGIPDSQMVDQYVIKVDRAKALYLPSDQAFSWNDGRSRKVGFSPTERLGLIAAELEGEARTLIEQGQVRKASRKIQDFETIDPKNDSLRELLVGKVKSLIAEAEEEKDWAAVSAYSKFLYPLDREDAVALSLRSQEALLLGGIVPEKNPNSERPKVLFKPEPGEQLRLTPRGVATSNFWILDQGVSGEFEKELGFSGGNFGLPYGNVRSISKERTKARFDIMKYSDPRPSIEMRTEANDRWFLIFESEARRDGALKILENAREAWEDRTTAGKIVLKEGRHGQIVYSVSLEPNTWSPEFVLSDRLELFERKLQGYYYRRPGEESEALENTGTLPLGVPIQLMIRRKQQFGPLGISMYLP